MQSDAVLRAALLVQTRVAARGGTAHPGDRVHALSLCRQTIPRAAHHWSTLAVLVLSLPSAGVESALGNLQLLLVNGFVRERPSLGANLPRAGAAVRGKFSAALAYAFAQAASGFYGDAPTVLVRS